MNSYSDCVISKCNTGFKVSDDATKCERDWDFIGGSSKMDCSDNFVLQTAKSVASGSAGGAPVYCSNDKETGMKWTWGADNELYPYCAPKVKYFKVQIYPTNLNGKYIENRIYNTATGYRVVNNIDNNFINSNIIWKVIPYSYEDSPITPVDQPPQYIMDGRVPESCSDAAIPSNETGTGRPSEDYNRTSSVSALNVGWYYP